jgi:hypothetical protein
MGSQLAVTDGRLLLGYEACLDGHVYCIDDIENAIKYAKNSEHHSKFQNAINDIHMSSYDSIILHPWGIIILLELR